MRRIHNGAPRCPRWPTNYTFPLTLRCTVRQLSSFYIIRCNPLVLSTKIEVDWSEVPRRGRMHGVSKQQQAGVRRDEDAQ